MGPCCPSSQPGSHSAGSWRALGFVKPAGELLSPAACGLGAWQPLKGDGCCPLVMAEQASWSRARWGSGHGARAELCLSVPRWLTQKGARQKKINEWLGIKNETEE